MIRTSARRWVLALVLAAAAAPAGGALAASGRFHARIAGGGALTPERTAPGSKRVPANG